MEEIVLCLFELMMTIITCMILMAVILASVAVFVIGIGWLVKKVINVFKRKEKKN